MKMKNLLKKAFLLLALMGGANSVWADDEVIFSWTSKTGLSNADINANTYNFTPAAPGDYLASLSGGNVSMIVPSDGNMRIRGSQLAYNSNNAYFHITLSKALAAGDKIDINSSGNTNNIYFSLEATRPGNDAAAAAVIVQGTTYTIGIDNDLIGETEFYVWRKGSTTQLGSFTITRPDQSKSPSNLTLTSSDEVTLNPEATSQITYTTSSTGAVTYTSSATGVATVSSTGLITGVAKGTATITINQAADASYNAGSKTVSVTVNFVRKATEVTGEYILDTEKGSQSSNTYVSNDGSVLIEAGTTGAGSNTYNDLKDSHFKISGNCLITLPTNYPVSTIWYVGYSNSDADRAITLKEVDGVAVSPEPSADILKRNQTPGADCVGFEFASPATESIKINIAAECRGYFILNPAAKNIAMTQVGANYYATFYSAGEVTITGATAYTAEFDQENSKLVLTECVGGVVGGRTGVILIGNSATATATPSFTGAAKNQGDLIGVAEKAVAMANYYAGSTSAAGKVFVLGNDEGNVGLYKYTGTNLGVNKAYLYTEAFAGGSTRSITFTFGDNITSINGVNTENVKAELKKFFENGRLVIEKEGKRFNAAGAKLY